MSGIACTRINYSSSTICTDKQKSLIQYDFINRTFSFSVSMKNTGMSANAGQKHVRCDPSKCGVPMCFRVNILNEGRTRAASDGNNSNEHGAIRASHIRDVALGGNGRSCTSARLQAFQKQRARNAKSPQTTPTQHPSRGMLEHPDSIHMILH